VLTVKIPAGVHDGQHILLNGEGDSLPGRRAGDVVCVVDVARHPRFQRIRDDLATSAEITLTEALAGCSVQVEHLDGRRLALRSRPGQVIKPGSLWRVRGEGMPVFTQGQARGDLLVQFSIIFPDRVDTGVAENLAALLGRAALDHSERARDAAQLEQRYLEAVDEPQHGHHSRL